MRAVLLLLSLVLAACGGNDHSGTPPPAPTASPTPSSGVTLIERPTQLEFRTAAAAIRVDRATFKLTLLDAAGRQLTAERTPGLRYSTLDGEYVLGAVERYELHAAERRLTVFVTTGAGASNIDLIWSSDRTLRVRFPTPSGATRVNDTWSLTDGESIYGLTERPTDAKPINGTFGAPPIDEIAPRAVGGLDRRGETVQMLVRATYGVYAPFYQSSNGYGLFVDATTPGSYDIGKSDTAALDYSFQVGSTPEGRDFSFDLFVGTPAQILDQYTARTGRPFIPPEWAFRHWRWRDEHARGAPVELDGELMNAQVAEDLMMYEALDIPVGVYMIDRPWAGGTFGFDDFSWDATRFPNPDGMLRVLRERGYRVAIWSAALATGSAPGSNGAEARDRGYLAPGNASRPAVPDAQVIDLTNPDARTWWLEKHVEFIRRWDISAIKLDRGEEYVSWDDADVFADDRLGSDVHNQFPALNLRLYHDLLQAARGDGDFVVKARAAWAGAQRWGIVWGGDTPGATAFGAGPGTDLGLRTALIELQRAAFLGFPFWGSDTGGYYEFKQRDVFARWLQFSAFCPLMEIGGHGTHAPWAMPTEPPYDEEMIAIYQRYVRLHHALIPYVMDAAAESARSGLPIARPLVFAYPDDVNVRDRWDEYLYGDDLLVAPLWQNGARSREVYLPAGRWEDFWDRTRSFEGPATITVDAPLDVIPVFVRAGADVPGRP
ncbi:MAG: glycoside hydrolase family 31 protein [Deltaproteobacteria bacterium]|nr:glycoside hydrolase family 31 protein [Deltaproteobacteria bacterium]